MNLSCTEAQSVLITGCSPGGIGHALACEFHRRGLRVLATARNTDDIQDLSLLGIETLELVVDDAESVRQCFSEVETRVGHRGLDWLINNAGRNFTVPAVEVDLAEARALFEVNFFAVVHMCQTFLPLLMRAQGTIVQIGSITGVLPYAFGSIYNASKAALLAFSDTLRVELAPFGVHVSVIITGYVQSRIARTKRMLREDSLYQPLRVEYEHRLTHSQQGSMPHDVYARRVVARLLDPVWPCWWPRQGRARPSRWIWEGGWSKLVMVSVGGWLWLGLWEWIFTWMLKLWKLQRK